MLLQLAQQQDGQVRVNDKQELVLSDKYRRSGTYTLEDVDEVLFVEPGSSWCAIMIGPLLIGVVLVTEILGQGQVHWGAISTFLAIITGSGCIFITAARTYVSVELTRKTLRCGTSSISLSDIAVIYPETRDSSVENWQTASVLGGFATLPRGRKGIGIKTTSGKLIQAWARDVDSLRTQLKQAHMAAIMRI